METLVKNIVKEKQPFERLEMKKEDLLEMFKVSNWKYYIFKKLWKYFLLKIGAACWQGMTFSHY